MGSNNFASSSQPIQQSRKGIDLVQHHPYSQIQDHQAQFQHYALQAAHYKSSLPLSSGKEHGNPKTQEPRSIPAPNSSPQMGIAGNMARQNIQIMPAQYQAMQAWALDRNTDLPLPANAGLMAQMLPMMQSRMASQQKSIDSNANMIASENSPHGNSSSDASGGSGKSRQVIPPSPFGSTPNPNLLNTTGNNPLPQQFGGENQLTGQRIPSMPPPNPSCVNMCHTSSGSGQEMKYPKQNQSSPQANDGILGNKFPSQHQFGFTKQLLHVFKAQILAFRRLKKGDGTLPEELLRAIGPPLPGSQMHLESIPAGTGATNSDRRNIESNSRQMDGTEKDPQTLPPVYTQNDSVLNESISTVMNEKEPVLYARKEEQQACALVVNSEVDSTTSRSDIDKGKAVAPQETISMSDGEQVKKPIQVGNESHPPKDGGSARKYHGPLFDFPVFTRKHDSIGVSSMGVNNSNGNNLALAYDVKDLLFEEGMEVFQRKRTENMKKIGGLLAVNLERKRISPDIVLRLQIEEKKLRLLDIQAKLRDEIDQNQQEIMTMPDRLYRKFVRQCERQRTELARHVQVTQRAMREKQLKSIFLWRKKLLESHWAIRDSRTARNRGVAKYHERMMREFSKRKDDDRNKRMEALKNNDVQRYREMLMEQQTNIPGDTGERYAVLSSFLTQTENYLQKLGGKITAAKSQQEVDEAANAAAIAARAQGLSEEEVRAAAACAREEVMIRNRFSEMNAPRDNSSVNKYYNLAHAVSERVMRQPSMLRAGTLRDYQLVGLQWMLSLYNNKLNGILADEMGLGKTVQVMALIAYLMEFKGNYGPHLIIVPNAVLVNWKSELHTWLPSVSCIYYVGGKDQRAKLFSQEVCALKFNVLVTTYEFIMYDRTKLSKIDWKYIVIDEAQRMKDRESVLARDLDRYRCQRRLLLTGTPLQNDLKELWSLLNLLLPEVFDNRKAFHDWFSQPFQKETHNAEDDWLETEKKVIIIHRLHQILEPFMLRRRVEDVEGSLPPKVSIVIKCRMSAIQSSIYDWIKTTGTIRVDPEDEQRRVQKNSNYQPKAYKPLNNRCMELRKTCNHPLLNYPYFFDFSKDFLVRSCGKLWILDRILVKLQRTGHRVLLFSTMTKLLDILEEYLQWRRLVYRRIDGTTSLEDRESAIVEFNSPDSECFIFLLSIRAAGRGLNLQSADTVVIYDPDPNPKNEEQAVARAHRIGQKREVKVIYLEAVVDKIASHQKEDEFRNGGMVDMEDDDELEGKDRYMGSIESLIRNNIQQYKIDMADEVINAGRFDQRTTHEERRLTLETLLHDEDRFQETLHDVPSLMEVNQMIARSKEEVEFFNQMDEEFNWAEDTLRYDEVPKWLRTSSKEVNATVANLSKKPLRNSLYISNIGMENHTENQSSMGRKKRGRPKKFPNYAELYDENEGFSDASSEEKIGDSVHEEEGETEEFEYEETGGAVEAEWADPLIKDQVEDDAPACESPPPEEPVNTRNNHIIQEPGSSGSSSDTRRLTQIASPISSQKFGSLSALDARPGSVSKRMPDDLEDGEIAASGDSHMDQQQSGSWIHDHEENEYEQVLQPRIKRKRSIRLRPRQSLDKPEDKSINEKPYFHRINPSLFPFQLDHNKHESQLRIDLENKASSSFELPPSKHVKSEPSLKNRRTLSSRKSMTTLKSSRLISVSTSTDDATELTRESWDGKHGMMSCGTSNVGTKMSDAIQKKCKTVLSKLQRRIDKEGNQIVPLLTDLWKRGENYGYMGGPGTCVLDIRKIDQRVDRFEYNGVMSFVADVQNMLKSALQFFRFSNEVRTEARKVHDLFFDIMKIAFPDSDFRDARNPNFISAPFGPPARPAPISALNKRHRLINEVEPVPDPRPRLHMPLKNSRTGPGREQLHRNDDSALLMHPGELVICKKRRKEREKMAAAKVRGGSGLPVSPPVVRSGSIQYPSSRGSQVQQQQQQQGWVNPVQTGGSNVGWANPVKRMRTDAGKRRPSHL